MMRQRSHRDGGGGGASVRGSRLGLSLGRARGVRRLVARLRARRNEAHFHKAYPDYILGDDVGPSRYDRISTASAAGAGIEQRSGSHPASAPRAQSFNEDPTWTPPVPVQVVQASAPPGGFADDEYMNFSRGKRAPRYLSFSEGVDIEQIDLSVPAAQKRRLSFRWSDVAVARSRSGRLL